jgi:heavy metal translocating P-type ATPase
MSTTTPTRRMSWEWALVAVTLAGLGIGALAYLLGSHRAATLAWTTTTIVGIVVAAGWVIDALRRRRLGVDVIALLALCGALVVHEELAGAVIAVMLATGRALEAWAAGRARRELQALAERAPRQVHRHGTEELETVPLESVVPGELILVQPGEVVPLDGLMVSQAAITDESALTGEPIPVEHATGDPVRSGVVNAGGPFDLRVTTSARDSTYAGILRLVEAAETSTPPFVRLADRFAVWFLGATLVVAGAAWAVSGELSRAVAVLVVATPCPLILAAPVAFVSGLSRTAKRGVVVKGGGALERLARCRTLLFDKTGTITVGKPTVAAVVPAGVVPADELLGLAASLEQVSPHVLAGAVVRAAVQRDQPLTFPTGAVEVPGQGVRGQVGWREVKVGRADWVGVPAGAMWARRSRRRAEREGALTLFVGVDGAPAGLIVLDDPIRNDAARTVRALRRGGIDRIVLVTGDRAAVAETVGSTVGVDDVLAERTPAEKVDAVRAEHLRAPTMMVGDGINDAPALALADVGVAIGARGATASSEAADVVLTVDRLDRLSDAIVVARRTRRIAFQSVIAGMGMSLAAMVAAAFGYLPAVWGALLQEAIDVAVILNAMRVLLPQPAGPRLADEDAELAQRFSTEHVAIWADLVALRQAADALGTEPPATSLDRIRAVYELLVDEVLPHELAEDETLYPALTRVLGGTDPLAPMSRAHAEITHLIRRLGGLLDEIDPGDPDDDDLAELRRVLYGLHAILRLHTVQEEESYLSLAETESLQDSHGSRPGASGSRNATQTIPPDVTGARDEPTATRRRAT